MRKKVSLFCVLIMLLVVCLPVASSDSFGVKRQSLSISGDDTVQFGTKEIPKPAELTGYLLIHVSVYTPGEGLHPYDGANITIRGLFHNYTGKTDDKGDCLFQLHSRLFRPKLYFIKVTIPPADWMHTKINSLYILTGQIVYRDYLFVVLK